MNDDTNLDMYERNQELIEEMWEDLIEDENDVKRIVFNFDRLEINFPV